MRRGTRWEWLAKTVLKNNNRDGEFEGKKDSSNKWQFSLKRDDVLFKLNDSPLANHHTSL